MFDKRILMKDSNKASLPFGLHLPLQAASNKVLKDMRRRYSFEDYQDFIQLAYREVPDICLGTDIIVGFPTEHQAEFERGIKISKKRLCTITMFFLFLLAKKQELII